LDGWWRVTALGTRRAARLAGSLAATAALGLAAAGCNLTVPRGPVTDFLAKDFDLPSYEPARARFVRERRRVGPATPTAALGGVPGAVAGGNLRAWHAASSGSVGGVGGAVTGNAFSYAQRSDPLPEGYPMLTLGLPIIATDPNKGPTVGLLGVGVVREGDRITNIFAPDATWNEIDGPGLKFRMRRFFSRDSSLLVDAGSSTNGAQDYDLDFVQRRVGPKRSLFFRGRFWYSTTLANRFYGVGNETDEDAETSYVFRRTTAVASLGIQLPLDLSIELEERIVSYKVGPGRLGDADDEIPSTRAVFPDLTGATGERLNVLTHRITLTYDSRDQRSAATEGVFGQFTYELADDTLGSDISFQRFGLSLTVLIPKLEKRFITALHFAGWILDGDPGRIPFYELTAVGGKSTIRGYGAGRFVDQNGFVANVEERWNLVALELMDVELVLQVAGFVDVGRVYADGEDFSLDDLKVAAGGAIRLIVPDSDLVTSIDLGLSDEGTAVFVGLDYPW